MGASHSPEALLDGVRVIDLSRDVAGAYAAKLLVDCGADVLRVEPPQGGGLRTIAAEPDEDGILRAINAGKRSATIDLAREEGAALFRALLIDFDLVVEDFPPGELDRLGLGYQRLASIKPRLVQVSVTPFGLHGPASGREAADRELLAAAGLDAAEAGPYAARLRAGLHAFAAAAMAVYGAFVLDSGRRVEVATLEALAATLPTGARTAGAVADLAGGASAPFALNGAQLASGRVAALGEHTDQVLLAELDLDPDEVALLRAGGVV